jgi:sulfoxide reductase catalytic subunit YedY
MANIMRRPGWHLPEKLATPERAWRDRRGFLQTAGLASAGALAFPWLAGDPVSAASERDMRSPRQLAARKFGEGGPAPKAPPLYPAPRNPAFNPKWALTDPSVAGSYNNFYEFSFVKDRVKDLTGKFVTSPWSIQIGGLVEKPMTLTFDQLLALAPLEERVYRFRCVEAWAMIVPWTGFPLAKLIEKAAPKPEAAFLRFETCNRPDQFPGLARLPNYPWPYFEGLRLDEAMSPLTLVATGIYGKPVPKQHGAPVRIVVPWKYGYKSIKSVVKIDFVKAQPATFWETLARDEYPFESNVNPKIPHPRWSQAAERMIDTNDWVKTQPYNGYGSFVAKLYPRA